MSIEQAERLAVIYGLTVEEIVCAFEPGPWYAERDE